VGGSAIAHLGVQLGKDGIVRLLDLDNLSGHGGPGFVAGELQKVPLLSGAFGNFATPQPVIWTDAHGDGSVWVFASIQNVLSGLQLTLAGGRPSLMVRWTIGSMGESSSPIIANNVLYGVTTGRSSATIKAFAPTTGNLLWTSPTVAGCCHTQSPI